MYCTHWNYAEDRAETWKQATRKPLQRHGGRKRLAESLVALRRHAAVARAVGHVLTRRGLGSLVSPFAALALELDDGR